MRSDLEHGPRKWIDVIAAVIAGVSSTASHAVVFALDATCGAVGYDVRPALLFNVFKAGIIVGELGIEVCHGVAQFLWNTLRYFHANLRSDAANASKESALRTDDRLDNSAIATAYCFA